MPTRQRPLALLDACVLAPMPLADTLLRLAEAPAAFDARWSDEILAEVARTLELKLGRSASQVKRREATMRRYFPQALVENYVHRIPTLRNDPKDRHVLAAALEGECDYLVTYNLKDFPAAAIAGFPIQVMGPSAFLRLLFDERPGLVERKLTEQADALDVPFDVFVDRLSTSVPSFAAAILARRDPKSVPTPH